jgi:hypothetical protein
MRKIAFTIVALLVAFAVGSFGWEAYFLAQRADYGWSPKIVSPSFTAEHPRVLIDEGHHNASTAGIAGRYWPLARLLRADGYDVARGKKAFAPDYLAQARVLLIANASGADKPQLFGINLPAKVTGKRSDPAFTDAEIRTIHEWVERGGSLLLIADHAPFGQAAAALGAAFGVTMHQGFMEVPNENSDPLVFSRENGRLGKHPILSGEPGGSGDGRGKPIQRVMTFTGQSLDGPPGSTILLRVPPNAIEYVPVEGDSMETRPAGTAQGLAFEVGKGRVVVLGEAAMATAQVAKLVPFGMNIPGNDNQQFVLRTMRWLSRGM